MTELMRFSDIERLCPKDCKFLFKKENIGLFLCIAYTRFLENGKNGFPLRCVLCGSEHKPTNLTVLSQLYAKVRKTSPDFLSNEQWNALTNIFQVLDNSEQEMMMIVLANQNLCQQFLKEFQNQPMDKDLLANTRAVLKSCEKTAMKEKDLEELKRLMLSGRVGVNETTLMLKRQMNER